MGCYIWYSEEGPERAAAPPSPLLAVPNVTTHRLTASVSIAVLLYNGSLLCGFNVFIKGLIFSESEVRVTGRYENLYSSDNGSIKQKKKIA